jgi:hypothetical protein
MVSTAGQNSCASAKAGAEARMLEPFQDGSGIAASPWNGERFKFRARNLNRRQQSVSNCPVIDRAEYLNSIILEPTYAPF